MPLIEEIINDNDPNVEKEETCVESVKIQISNDQKEEPVENKENVIADKPESEQALIKQNEVIKEIKEELKPVQKSNVYSGPK